MTAVQGEYQYSRGEGKSLITAFTIPKPFVGRTNIIQRNALKSWKASGVTDIILIGDDEGVADLAEEYGFHHIPHVEKNQYGTPLLSSAFYTAQELAKNDTVMYVNSDIVFFRQLIEAVQTVSINRFLLCGRRWDLNIQHEIDFDKANWAEELQQRVASEGELHGLSGIDYFIFRRNTVEMLPFAVGRPGWDSWLIFDMRRKKIPIINASEAIMVIHQNHDYSHSKFGERKRVGGPEWEENIRIAGGLTNVLSLRDAEWILTRVGLKRPSLPNRILALISLWYPWRLLLAMKRNLQGLSGRR